MPGVQISTTEWTKDENIRLGDNGIFTVIGDVHGCRDQLAALFDALPEDSDVTMLGDLADRGPDSPGTFRLAAAHSRLFRRFTFLPGNHEQLLVATVTDPSCPLSETFYLNGGKWALELDDLDRIQAHVVGLIGPEAWMMVTGDGAALRNDKITMHRRMGNVVLVHAGVAPGADIDRWVDQADFLVYERNHPLWIRDEFLRYDGPYGTYGRETFVVHGHTPEYKTTRHDGSLNEPGVHVADGWRLGIDGGSFKSGIVTAAQLREGAYRIITARPA